MHADNWRTITDFPAYAISPHGEVMEIRTNRLVTVETSDHRETVRLRRDNGVYRRGVRKLVARMYRTDVDFEGWFPIPGFETYEANSDGDVRQAHSGKPLVPRMDSGTYYILFKNGVRHKRSINSIINAVQGEHL